MDYYTIRETELNEKLKRIYSERYELIKQSDVRLRSEYEVLKTLFMSNVMKAKFRNDLIMKECLKIIGDIKSEKKQRKEEDKRFKILKENYWSMVKSVYPIWLKDYEAYLRKHNLTAAAVINEPIPEEQNSINENTIKSISKSLPNNETYNDESSRSQSKTTTQNKQQKRRRTARELMDQIDKSEKTEN